MHDALFIPEIRSAILDTLVADSDTVPHPTLGNPWCPHPIRKDSWRAGQRALAMLARTCRALSEPALDALWHRLHSLEPFLRCMGAKNNVVEDEPGPLAPFNEEEWSIVLHYAPRVQELTVSSADTKILQAVWFCTTLLLPNLRKLHWSDNDIAQIRLMLSPSLVNLYVWLDDGDHTSILGFLEHYHKFCPNVKSLYFNHLDQNLSPLAVAAISRAISRSSELEVLTCHEINEDTITHLIQSHRLKKLFARLHHHHPDNLRRLAGYSALGYTPFQNLRALDLYVQDISSVTPYLHSTHQPFEELSIEFLLITPPEDFHEFFSALNSSMRRQTLRHIRLVHSGPDIINTMQLSFELLNPLLAFSLRTLDLNLTNPISLNDGELVQLAQAWPDLEQLNLNQYNVRSPFCLPSLRGLLLMLARCPKLHTLGLCVDARTIPVLTAEESAIRNVLIQTLGLSYSPIARPVVEGVAHFLLDHLPSLSGLRLMSKFLIKFELDGVIESTYRSMWKAVYEKIKKAKCENSPWRFWESSDGDSEVDFEVLVFENTMTTSSTSY
ncbi:hypothetical protein JVU11DRAFT_7082 [Chiua virens]|nr:hypothetical protein JVU11DRAFT_7082 [Chiua virens]